jgi:hypothetical protein
MKKLPHPSSNSPVEGKINLSASERASLNAALAGATSGTHIHADVVNGQIRFSSESVADNVATSHVSGNEPEVSLTNGGPYKKVVATETAAQLLKKRMAR